MNRRALSSSFANTPLKATALAAALLFVATAHAQDAPEPPSAEATPQRGERSDGEDRQRVRSDREAERQRAERDARRRNPQVQRQSDITVRGKRDVDDRQVSTASKLVIDKEEIERHGDTNIADVLKRAPGVTIGGAAGRGGGEIRMRGLGRGYTQVLINGEPAPPGFSLDTLAPDQLERIEIFRTATAQFSTQAVAGSINLVLKDGDLPPEKAVRFGIRTGTRAGVFSGFSVNDKIGKFTYNLGLSLNKDKTKYNGSTTEQGFDAAGTPTLERFNQQSNSGNNSGGNLNARLRYALTEADSLALDVFARRNDFTGVYDESITTRLGLPPRFAAAHTDVDANGSGSRWRLNYTHKFLKDSPWSGGKFEARAGLNRNNRASLGAFQGTNPLGQLALLRQTDSGATDDGTSANAKLTLPLGDGHQVVTGIDLERSERSEFRVQNEQTPLPIASVLPLVFANERFGANVRRTAWFAQDEWDVTPNWSLYVGLRQERIETTSQGNTYAPIANTAQVTSPILQSLWKLSPKGEQLRLGLSRTFKAPGTSQLIPRRFTAVNNSPLTPDSMGNPLLQPELATGIDLAFERFFRSAPNLGQGVFSVSTYVRRVQGVIFSQTTLQGTGPDARWVSMPTNIGNALVKGVELEFKTPLQNLWPEAPPIDIRANAAINRSAVDNIPGPNNRLAAQTPCSANLGFDHRVNPAFAYGSSFSYSCGGPYRRSATQSGDQSDKRELDAYAVLRFKPSAASGMQLRVSAVNLLQRTTRNSSTNADAFGRLSTLNEADTHAALRVNLEGRFR